MAFFYGYGDGGEHIWLLGSGPGIDGDTAAVNVIRTEGVGFGGEYDPDLFDFETVGSMTFTFSDCDSGSVSFTPDNGDLSAFTMDIVRNTNIASLDCSLLSGGQVDRVGRPLTSTLFISGPVKDAYNAASDPATWVTTFGAEVEAGLQALDTADGVVGNMFNDPQTLAPVFADDRLQVDIRKGQTVGYFGIESSKLAPQDWNESGGRALWVDALDETLSMLVSAWDPMVGDYVDANDVAFLQQFPFLAAPH